MDGRDYGGNVKVQQQGNVTWVDVQDPGSAVLTRLEQDFRLHPLHLSESIQRIQHNQVEREEDYIFLVLHFPVFEPQTDKISVGQLGVFLGTNYVITIHIEQSLFIADLFTQCKSDANNGSEQSAMRSAGYLLYIITSRLLGNIEGMTETVETEMDEIENLVFENSGPDAERIGRLRQKIVRLRRLIGPKKPLLQDLADEIGTFAGKDLRRYYANNVKTVNRLWEAVEEAKETIEIYKDVDFTTSTEQTNRILAILTLVFTFTIPVTVVASIYGMNVPLPGGVTASVWTFLGRYTTFGLLLTVSVLTAVGMYVYFHKKKWF